MASLTQIETHSDPDDLPYHIGLAGIAEDLWSDVRSRVGLHDKKSIAA
jgi:hypothetical protein